MFCKCGSRKSAVVNTLNGEDFIRRQRRCSDCNSSFFTRESRIELDTRVGRPAKLKPVPNAHGLFKEEDVSAMKKEKVDTRRRNEDRVSDYCIEDEYE